MIYKALYRRFRPLLFSDVIGQEHITNTLKNQIQSNKVAHAYLFSGGRGSGKTTTAKQQCNSLKELQHPVYGKSYLIGEKVKLVMFNNYTESNIHDDEIVNVKIIKK